MEFQVNVQHLKGLRSLKDASDSEILDILQVRYPLAYAEAQIEKYPFMLSTLKRYLATSFEPEFASVFNSVYQLAKDVDTLDHNWYCSTEPSIEILGLVHGFEAQQRFGLLIDNLPDGPAARRIIIPLLGQLYKQLCEDLAHLTYAAVASLGSALKNERKGVQETFRWSTRSLSEYILSIAAGKYSSVLRYYDPVIRNAFAHEHIKYRDWSPEIELRDNREERVLTGEQLSDIVYRFKQTIDHAILALNFYGLSQGIHEADCMVRKLDTAEAVKAFFALERIASLQPNPMSLIRSLELEHVEYTTDRTLRIRVRSPEVEQGKEKDCVLAVLVMLWTIIRPLVYYAGHNISALSVRVQDAIGRSLGKATAPISTLRTIDHRLYPAQSVKFFPGPSRKRR